MENITFDDGEVERNIEANFIFVDIGIDDKGSVIHKDFSGNKYAYAKSLDISFYPTVGFMDGNNSYVHGVIGYRDPKRFLKHLKYMQTNAYRKMDFEAYKTHLEFEAE